MQQLITELKRDMYRNIYNSTLLCKELEQFKHSPSRKLRVVLNEKLYSRKNE